MAINSLTRSGPSVHTTRTVSSSHRLAPATIVSFM
uniref:Uncharacterized protein n=1 Tax=Arundo donax TaxID=35708 RepID=A0A0A9DN91_ARUDO